ALRELESLWRRWLEGALPRGYTKWRDVFARLRDLRPWGPEDRVEPEEAAILAQEIFGLPDNALVRLELELVYRAARGVADDREGVTERELEAQGGTVITRARIEEIAYHALLVDLPVRAVRAIIAHGGGVAALEPVMHIRPQSLATGVELEDTQPT